MAANERNKACRWYPIVQGAGLDGSKTAQDDGDEHHSRTSHGHTHAPNVALRRGRRSIPRTLQDLILRIPWAGWPLPMRAPAYLAKRREVNQSVCGR